MVLHQEFFEKEKRRKGAEGRADGLFTDLLFPFSPLLLYVLGVAGNSEFRIPNSEIEA